MFFDAAADFVSCEGEQGSDQRGYCFRHVFILPFSVSLLLFLFVFVFGGGE
jgi:hypothetical protein